MTSDALTTPPAGALANDPVLVQLRPAIAEGSVLAMEQFVAILCVALSATRSVHAPGGRTCVDLVRRHVYGPQIVSVIEFAQILHELMHLIVGPCAGPLHGCNDHGSCLECERLAWSHALTIFPFTAPMFAELRRCLGTYRALRGSSREAALIATIFQGTTTFARRANFQARLDLQRQHRQSLGRQRAAFGCGRSWTVDEARRALDQLR